MIVTAVSFGLPAAVRFGFPDFYPLSAVEIQTSVCLRSELSYGKLLGGRYRSSSSKIPSVTLTLYGVYSSSYISIESKNPPGAAAPPVPNFTFVTPITSPRWGWCKLSVCGISQTSFAWGLLILSQLFSKTMPNISTLK
ncbi:hypothetical protein [Paenibacillus sp. FSL R10-2771]|uniref:hypothetical protein n=1 Tax=Paenibacillus sp. FSL R10-2771 TaxID=2954693 RepID=UPI0030F63EB5